MLLVDTSSRYWLRLCFKPLAYNLWDLPPYTLILLNLCGLPPYTLLWPYTFIRHSRVHHHERAQHVPVLIFTTVLILFINVFVVLNVSPCLRHCLHFPHHHCLRCCICLILTTSFSFSPAFSLFGIGASNFQSPCSPVLCFFHLYSFLLDVFSYNITPPQFRSSYLLVSTHFHFLITTPCPIFTTVGSPNRVTLWVCSARLYGAVESSMDTTLWISNL